MPRFLEAEGTFPHVLESDKGKENAPEFLLAVLSKRDSKNLRKLTRQYFDEKDIDRRDELLTEAMAIVLKGWKNIPIEFNADNVEKLTELECLELVSAATLGTYLSAEDKKKSESASKSETA